MFGAGHNKALAPDLLHGAIRYRPRRSSWPIRHIGVVFILDDESHLARDQDGEPEQHELEEKPDDRI
jgi:hypothetical protein